jgi:hypothetical protein
VIEDGALFEGRCSMTARTGQDRPAAGQDRPAAGPKAVTPIQLKKEG